MSARAADEVCMEHSGCDARITQCEKNDEVIFPRLLACEMSVVRVSVITGLVSAVGSAALVVLFEKVWK